MLHARTKATLDELFSVAWFSKVGDPVYSNDVETVDSWEEAMECCGSPNWHDAHYIQHNRLSESLFYNWPQEYRRWNAIVDEIEILTLPLIKAQTAQVIEKYCLPKYFIDFVEWEIVHIGLEVEFAHCVPPGFFVSLSHWYFNGRYPCGIHVEEFGVKPIIY